MFEQPFDDQLMGGVNRLKNRVEAGASMRLDELDEQDSVLIFLIIFFVFEIRSFFMIDCRCGIISNVSSIVVDTSGCATCTLAIAEEHRT